MIESLVDSYLTFVSEEKQVGVPLNQAAPMLEYSHRPGKRHPLAGEVVASLAERIVLTRDIALFSLAFSMRRGYDLSFGLSYVRS